MYLVRCSVLKPSQSYATIGRFGLYFSCSTLLAGERARSALFSVVEHDGTYTLQCHCARHSGVSHFILLSLSISLARSLLPPLPPSPLPLFSPHPSFPPSLSPIHSLPSSLPPSPPLPLSLICSETPALQSTRTLRRTAPEARICWHLRLLSASTKCKRSRMKG